ncbi:MarR family winged helix-turn-helix transcriptional regulator [Povalibacter sp.]|uniref:MarR family winged helix-turn-helix transcriptional regulator n=1 Tax=Povalibacter sp. TaxID=1962978 RepID=UPI002F401619
MRRPRQPSAESICSSASTDNCAKSRAIVTPGPFGSEPDNRKRSISIKLNVIARQIRQRFDQAVEADGLTRPKWGVIVAVARNAGATQRSIASMLEITEVSAGQLIDRLCADGYLERRENPKDRRAYCVHLTPAAQPLISRLGDVAKINEDETFIGLSEQDLARFEKLLDSVAQNLATSRSRDAGKKLRPG